MNQIKKFHIQLPVTIGKNQLLSHKPEQILSSDQFTFKLDIQKNSISRLSQSQMQKSIIMCSCQLFQNEIHILDSTEDVGSQQFLINLTKSKQKPIFSYSYSVSIIQKQNDFQMCIKKEKLAFCFTKIQSVKFVKNQILTRMLDDCSYQYDCGLLTKDQSDRFLTLNNETNFASIGIWQKSELPLLHPKTYQAISSYLKKQASQKCRFVFNGKSYIYLVRMTHKKKTPEAYLVSWNQNQAEQNNMLIPKKSIKKYISFDTSLQTQSQNGMEFTLRKNQIQTLQSAFSHSYISPIKHIQNNLHDQWLSDDLNQLSPQFSTIKKQQTPQNQCHQLRSIIKKQQNQIQNLNLLVSSLQRQLKMYKQKDSRVSTQCWSKSPIMCSPNYEVTNSSPRIIRKLRESDLRSNSFSVKNSSQKKMLLQRLKFEQNSPTFDKQFNTESRENKQKLASIKEDINEPWQFYQLVQTKQQNRG